MTTQLPAYISHQRVQASEIVSVGDYSWEGITLMRGIQIKDSEAAVMVNSDLFTRYSPVPGDFLVVYADGYSSFSPRKAFLEGYSPANDGNVLMERLSDLADTSKTLPPEAVPEWAKGHDFWVQVARVAREAYVTINSLKHQLENLNREKADPDQH